MKISTTRTRDLTQSVDCLVVAVSAAQDGKLTHPFLEGELSATVSRLVEEETFVGKNNDLALINAPSGLAAKRLLLVGLGDNPELSLEQLRERFAGPAKQLSNLKAQTICADFTMLNAKIDRASLGRHFVEALGDASFKIIKNPTAHGASDTADSKIESVKFIAESDASAKALKDGAVRGAAVNDGKSLAKTLGNLPGNVCTPTYLAEQAQALGQSYGFDVDVLDEDAMAELKMGSLLSVSKGSREPAKLIVMHYQGANSADEAPYALVGKGLTFDAGGISLKPGAKMDEMKYDMSGAASVLGTMKAVAELKLPINVVGVIPSSENLPDGLANKPGDVVTSMSGRTIEILNTDAEGRLILCDALTYVERFSPKSVIDIATLTGAVIVALGHQTAGLMGNDQALVDELLEAGDESLDFAWQLPIKETYKKQLKSDYADLANIGGPSAGTITAACFLSYFTENFSWAHLDIAGTAWGGASGKRASGRAVPILTQYLINQANG